MKTVIYNYYFETIHFFLQVGKKSVGLSLSVARKLGFRSALPHAAEIGTANTKDSFHPKRRVFSVL